MIMMAVFREEAAIIVMAILFYDEDDSDEIAFSHLSSCGSEHRNTLSENSNAIAEVPRLKPRFPEKKIAKSKTETWKTPQPPGPRIKIF